MHFKNAFTVNFVKKLKVNQDRPKRILYLRNNVSKHRGKKWLLASKSQPYFITLYSVYRTSVVRDLL